MLAVVEGRARAMLPTNVYPFCLCPFLGAVVASFVRHHCLLFVEVCCMLFVVRCQLSVGVGRWSGGVGY